jgi:hypothetical protein
MSAISQGGLVKVAALFPGPISFAVVLVRPSGVWREALLAGCLRGNDNCLG